MEKIDLEIDDFINYCDYKGLSKKTYGSYEQSLRLLVIYLKDKFKIKNSNQVEEKHLKDYIEYLKESELNNQLKCLKNKDVIIEIIEDFKTRIEFYNIYIFILIIIQE